MLDAAGALSMALSAEMSLEMGSTCRSVLLVALEFRHRRITGSVGHALLTVDE